MKYKLPAIISTLFLTLCFLFGCAHQTKTISKSGFYFDTIITITLYGTNDSTYIDHCFEMAKDFENKFSNTITTSEISKINDAAGTTSVAVSDETIELLTAGIRYGELSNGCFDLTLGHLSDLWNFSENANNTEKSDHCADLSILPSQEDIKACTKHIDYTKLQLKDNTVYLDDVKSKIDIGGIAKGYIADKMKKYLNAQGIPSGIINLGGNILTIGEKADGSDYTIGIEKPFDENRNAIATVKVKDKSVVTSGVYERYYKVQDTLYHHILDVKTGYPYDNGLYSVTIISDSSMDGDALSTTCFALGLEDGLTLIEGFDDTEAVFITSDYEIHTSSGIGRTIPFELIKN